MQTDFVQLDRSNIQPMPNPKRQTTFPVRVSFDMEGKTMHSGKAILRLTAKVLILGMLLVPMRALASAGAPSPEAM